MALWKLLHMMMIRLNLFAGYLNKSCRLLFNKNIYRLKNNHEYKSEFNFINNNMYLRLEKK
jgi:hypothetical protein